MYDSKSDTFSFYLGTAEDNNLQPRRYGGAPFYSGSTASSNIFYVS
jgi:hypothetical protein